jgi:hypothetical protein
VDGNAVANDVKMAFPPEGIDLLVNARWQGDKQAAVKLDVAVNGTDTITRTLWGTGKVSGVLTFANP